MVELSVIRDLVAIFGVMAGFSYYVMTVRINQRNQEISLKNQELALQSQELSRKAQEDSLHTRQAQLFMSIYSQYQTKEYSESFFEFTKMEYKSLEEFLEKYGLDNRAFQLLGSYFEGIGVMVREGYIDIRLVALLMSADVQVVWEKLRPLAIDWREKRNFSRAFVEFEYLYDSLLSYGKLHPDLGIGVDSNVANTP